MDFSNIPDVDYYTGIQNIRLLIQSSTTTALLQWIHSVTIKITYILQNRYREWVRQPVAPYKLLEASSLFKFEHTCRYCMYDIIVRLNGHALLVVVGTSLSDIYLI